MLLYVALTLALDIFVAISIFARIIWFKRKICKVLGTEHTRKYTSLAATIIESAMLDMLVGVPYLVLYGINHPAQILLLQILLQTKVSVLTYVV